MKRDILHAGSGTATAAPHSRLKSVVDSLGRTAASLAEPLLRWLDGMLKAGVPPSASVVLELARLADLDERVGKEADLPASRGAHPGQRSRPDRRRSSDHLQQPARHSRHPGQQHQGPQH